MKTYFIGLGGCGLQTVASLSTRLKKDPNYNPDDYAFTYVDTDMFTAVMDVLLILSQDASEAVLTAVNRSPESRPYDLHVNGVSASGELSAYGWDTKILSKSAK